MFTGLVSHTGTVAAAEAGRLRIDAGRPLEMAEGDSVAVNGVCLTVAELDGGRGFAADVMGETLSRSTLGGLSPGDAVNLELPLRASDRLGGHLVQGHVDGLARVDSVEADGAARVLRLAAPPALLRYVVEKGSVALEGVSLTVAAVHEQGFSVSLVPETLSRTTLGGLEPGASVNLEVDVLAKYVEKLAPAVRP